MEENEGIREYILPYKWAVGLEEIPGPPARREGRNFWFYGVPQRKYMKRVNSELPLILL